MARITAVIAASHSPFLFEPVEWWNGMHATRKATGGYAPGVPEDSESENLRKHARVAHAYEQLADVFAAAKPDVVLVFGDDQEEQFDSRNHPALAVYIGEAFHGYKAVAYEGTKNPRPLKDKAEEHWVRMDTQPALAKAVLSGLMSDGFDPAFMTSLPNEDFGMGHAFMRPLGKLTRGRFDVPMVPVLVNGLYPPQPSGARCVAAARSIRKSVEAWPEDINVVVLGSGGLWHTPSAPEAYLDEKFDQAIVEKIRTGDADGMAAYFDSWKPDDDKKNLKCFSQFRGKSGMPGGVGGGSGEVRNWIMAAAVADRPGTVVDYVPVYASPCGMGFAHWKMD